VAQKCNPLPNDKQIVLNHIRACQWTTGWPRTTEPQQKLTSN